MDRLPNLKIELKNELAKGLDLALKLLGEALNPASTKYNDFIQQKSRYAAYLSAIMIGGSSAADLDRVYNAISHAYLLLVDTLEGYDLKPDNPPPGASRSKRGELLYHIPHAMEMGKEHACRVRVAYLLDVIFEGWKKQAEDAQRQIRIAEIMSVEMLNLSHDQPFAIRGMTEAVQFLDADDYTEWLFYVRPLQQGEFPLLLKVSVVEVINGREVKKDVVIEEHVIVSSDAQEENVDFKESGIKMTFEQAENPVPSKSGGKAPAPKPFQNLRKAARPLALFLAFLMLSTVATYANTTRYTRGYWWALLQNSEQAYVDFIQEYETDPAFQTAPEREKSFFRLAKVSENPQLVREYVEKIDSAAFVEAHWTVVIEKLKILEIKAVTSLETQPTKEKVEQYVANFPEMNLLPKVLQILQAQPDLPTSTLPILEKAAVRQIGNPNVRPVQVKMYQRILPASQASLQQELEKRPALKQEVEQTTLDTDAIKAGLFVYTKQDYKNAGKNGTTTHPEGKTMQETQGSENNNPGEKKPEDIAINVVDKDTDGDGVPDNQDACPTLKGGVADKGCPPAAPPVPDDGMVFVKGGTFQMGSNDGDENEKPVHSVTLGNFYIGKYEVTVEEYLKFADETGDNYPEWLQPGNQYHIETGTYNNYKNKGYSRNASKLPVVGVSWNNAKAYCDWLSKKTGRNYRLPTEAEWEYAARGGAQSKGYKFAGSNSIDEVAWHSGNSNSKAHSVGSKKANELGLFDMSGNVYEWCNDWYDSGYYKNSLSSNPKGPRSGSFRVCRGGSWYFHGDLCSVAYRNLSFVPTTRSNYVGFRLARH